MKFRCISFVFTACAAVLLSSCAEAVPPQIEDETKNSIKRNVGASIDENMGSIRRPQDKRGSRMRMLKTTKNKQTKSSKKDTNTDTSEGQVCGADYCEAKRISQGGMKNCLMSSFQHLDNLYFPEDGDGYHESRYTANAVSRFPAAIVYVENVDEVKHALACAVDNGYKVSTRGGNHSYQGLGTMDGYVVIDMGSTCKPDEFVVMDDEHNQGPHILEGSKYIGTIKAQAGCTNAIMLAAGNKHFKDNDGMTLIGSCPSVGITGFVLGGGGGDASPYIGYAADMVKEFQIVLYNGTVVTASEEENTDLYWASRGGGGGNGIVTHLTYKIVQAPKQKDEEVQGKKFTAINMFMFHRDFEKGAARLQEWFYDADPQITGKFGGGFAWTKRVGVRFTFVYLGSWREAVDDMQSTGLLDHNLFKFIPLPYERTDGALLSENYEVKCPSFLAKIGACPEMDDYIPGATAGEAYPFSVHQFNSYAEVEAFNICIGGMLNDSSWPAWTRATGDFCKDLGIDDSHCEERFFSGLPFQVPKSCIDEVVIEAILNVSEDPSSFINSHGPSIEVLNLAFPSLTHPTLYDKIEAWRTFLPQGSASGSGMFPRFDDSFFAKLLNETSETSNHLQHGAALQVHPDETAYPWRNAALMIEYDSVEGDNSAADFIGRMMEGGYKPQGYYNYLNPPGMKNWRSYFFDDKWHKLAEIRGKYDPKDVFGKTLTIESLGE